MTAPSADGIPAGWPIELDPSVRHLDGGRVLVGGAPVRVLRLTDAGARWVAAATAGGAVASTPAERALARRLVAAGLAHPRPPAAAGPSLRDVAVVIPVRDMADGLATTLAAIGPVGEVIVVDDGSLDERAVRAATGGARVLRNDRPLGPAAARERGWRSTTLPFVAFVDAEVDADCDWLARLLPHFGDDAVGAVAPRVRADARRAPAVLAAYEETGSALDLGPRAALVRPGAAVPYVPTAALVVRRTALESVGGFDTELRVGEDVDLTWRLHEEGWWVRYEPAVEVIHPSRSSVAGWLHQHVAYGSSAAALARRHGGAAAALGGSATSNLSWAAFVLGHPVVAAGIAAASVGGVVRSVVRALGPVPHPTREAARLVAESQLRGARHVAEALRRPWWPFALLLAVTKRRSRPALLALLLLPAVLPRRARPRGAAPVPFAIAGLADDVAYGTGVWLGCIRARSWTALLPASVLGAVRGAERPSLHPERISR